MMRRWLAVGLGLLLLGAALWALARARPAAEPEIDEASRERLERVLRDPGLTEDP